MPSSSSSSSFCFLFTWVRRPARVIYHTKVTVYILKKKRASLFSFIQVLNFGVPERARLILHDKLLLYVLNFEYEKPRVLRDIIFLALIFAKKKHMVTQNFKQNKAQFLPNKNNIFTWKLSKQFLTDAMDHLFSLDDTKKLQIFY